MRKYLAVVVLVAACSNGAGSLDPRDVETYVANEYCAHLTRCGLFADRNTCLTARATPLHITGDTPPYAAALGAAVDAGAIEWDGAAAARCYTALFDPPSCDEDAVFKLTEACVGFAIGTLAANAACDLDTECVSGTCDRQCTNNDTCCAGTCADGDPPPTPHVGEQCQFTTGNVTRQFACVDSACGHDGNCVAYAAAGGDCSLAGAPCQPGKDLVCDPGTSTCVAAGASCANDLPCALLDQSCDFTASTCNTLQLPGGACAADADCAPSYRCDAGTQQCVDRAHVGEACATTRDCQQVGFCDPATQQCAAAFPVGAACTADEQCVVRCDTTTMTCADASACEL